MLQTPSITQQVGFDLLCLKNKFLVYNLVGRNLKLKYRESVLGFLWTLILPLCTAFIYYTVFQFIVKVPVPNYLAFILSGVLPWAFFAQTVNEGLESLRSNGSLLSKIPMPLHIFPYVGTVTNMLTLIFSLPIIVCAVVFSGIPLTLPALIVPFLLLLLFCLAYGFSLILSVGFVYFHDLRHLMSAVIQIWFYATPIVYTVDMIPQAYHWYLFLNPTGTLFVAIRDVLVWQQWPRWDYLVASTVWAAAALLLGSFLYRRTGKRLVEQL